MMNAPLNIEQPNELLRYLRDTQRIAPDETPVFETLRGGVSNRTVRVTRPSGEAWVMKQALAKLRVAVDWFSSPERIGREAAGLHHLHALAPTGTIPALIFEDHNHHLLAMEAVAEPHVNWKTLLLAGDVQQAHVEQFGRLLGTIHRASSGRNDLVEAFGDRSFFETLRVEPYYRYTAEQHPATRPFFDNLITETLSQRLAVVHGDYSPKNILVCNERLILLDHEVIHYGDPAFDLGFSLTHLLSKAHHVGNQDAAKRTEFLEAARLYWQSYLDALGDVDWREGLEVRAVRHTLACLLARVDGRSPLEYLSSAERDWQRELVLGLMANPLSTVAQLVARFGERVELDGS